MEKFPFKFNKILELKIRYEISKTSCRANRCYDMICVVLVVTHTTKSGAVNANRLNNVCSKQPYLKMKI